MKFGKVLTYKDIEGAKKLIGKKVVCSDYLREIENTQKLNPILIEELEGVAGISMATANNPFHTSSGSYQFICEVIEDEQPKRMTNRRLSEWLARGNGWVKFQAQNNGDMVYSFYNFFEDDEDKEVPADTRIRPWGSEEWIVPTVEIYERDCKGNKSDDRVAEDMVGKI